MRASASGHADVVDVLLRHNAQVDRLDKVNIRLVSNMDTTLCREQFHCGVFLFSVYARISFLDRAVIMR